MISRLSGILREKKEHILLIEVGGITYEVTVPKAIQEHLVSQGKLAVDQAIQLVIYHYYQNEPSRSYPVMIGFSNEVEREFFEQFITVSGVGPKAAVKALAVPISTIAKAIDRGDVVVLKSLPGIGIQRARDIIAKLQGKIGKFALIQDEPMISRPAGVQSNFEAEAVEVLLQLQYSRQEAKQMVEKALERNREIKTVEDLLNEVYKQRAQKAVVN
ncbi:MAG: hypothetical protein HYS56_02530 [Candidatus Omnitrophica bacterium]|nr:hypothetical protein [Candidatus Omnitrophota bacterium]